MTECVTDAGDGSRLTRRCISSIPIMVRSAIARSVPSSLSEQKRPMPKSSTRCLFTGRWVAMDKYQQYEKEKARIALTAKSAEEYQRRVKELADKLGI